MANRHHRPAGDAGVRVCIDDRLGGVFRRLVVIEDALPVVSSVTSGCLFSSSRTAATRACRLARF